MLDPEVRYSEFCAQAFGPKEVAVALEHGGDVFVADFRTDPLLFSPHSRSVRPLRVGQTSVEERLPLLRGAPAQRLQVMGDFEESIAFRAPIQHLKEVVLLAGAAFGALKVGAIAHEVPLPPPRGRHRDCSEDWPMRQRCKVAFGHFVTMKFPY